MLCTKSRKSVCVQILFATTVTVGTVVVGQSCKPSLTTVVNKSIIIRHKFKPGTRADKVEFLSDGPLKGKHYYLIPAYDFHETSYASR